jgi:dTDP-4-amino-4,6-dideoxygalactose transaminase
MKVPFVDLKIQYESIRSEVASALQAVLDQTAFAGGPFVAGFEKRFAEFCGVRHAIGVSSGTSALWLALLASGIGPGDEVITVPNTFIATAEAITFTGAKPVFIDVCRDSCLMDPGLIAGAITSRTKAVIPVHLFGQAADMDPIMEIASGRGLAVIEDACQAHGATYKGKRAGSIGDAGAFSFYPGKNLGAYGEAGAVVTSNDGLAARIATLRDHGQSRKYYHSMIGWNDRMDGFQAAVLDIKLKYLEDWNRTRRAHAALYDRLLPGDDGLRRPVAKPYGEHAFHIYAIRTAERDALIAYLAEKGVSCGIHYPVPIHLQEAYRFLGLTKGRFPEAEAAASEMVSLPMFAELTDEQIAYTAGQIRAFTQMRKGAQREDKRQLPTATA